MELSLSGGYSQCWKAIIRPPRDEYEIKDLGPKELLIHGQRVVRTDLTLTNSRGHKLSCSFFEIHELKRPCQEMPCVIFLHGNCSSRRGSFDCLEYLLPQMISLFTFDFSGCGQSEGDYISLGWHEREDLQCVIDYLRNSGRVSLIGLWGRSMGAATALLHGHRDPTIAGMVLDSPFSKLKQLAEELVQNNSKLPSFLTTMGLKLVRGSIQSKAEFDIFELNPIDNVESCFIPAFFLTGNDDNFVGPHHTKSIHEKYAGDKRLETFPGGHNGSRPDEVMFKISEFFYQTMQCDLIQQQLNEQKIKQQQEVEQMRQKLRQQKQPQQEEPRESVIMREFIQQSKNNHNKNSSLKDNQQVLQQNQSQSQRKNSNMSNKSNNNAHNGKRQQHQGDDDDDSDEFNVQIPNEDLIIERNIQGQHQFQQEQIENNLNNNNNNFRAQEFRLGMDEEEELRLAIIASIEHQRHEPQFQL